MDEIFVANNSDLLRLLNNSFNNLIKSVALATYRASDCHFSGGAMRPALCAMR